MQLFNGYLKEGKGIEKDEPEKTGLAFFCEVFMRKFFKLTQINLIYTLLSLPVFIIFLLFISPLYMEVFIKFDSINNMADYIMIDILTSILLFNFVGSGPISAAYSYIIHCFTKSKPVWIFSDGSDALKQNFKQSIAVIAIDIVVLTVMALSLAFYKTGASLLYSCLYYLTIIFSLIYLIAHTFIYQIMVTFECNFITIFKNAFIFTVAKLPVCLLITFIELMLTVFMISSTGFLGIIIYCSFGMSFAKFPLEVYSSRLMEKYIKDNELNQ